MKKDGRSLRSEYDDGIFGEILRSHDEDDAHTRAELHLLHKLQARNSKRAGGERDGSSSRNNSPRSFPHRSSPRQNERSEKDDFFGRISPVQDEEAGGGISSGGAMLSESSLKDLERQHSKAQSEVSAVRMGEYLKRMCCLCCAPSGSFR
jgi:hypothetical protein